MFWTHYRSRQSITVKNACLELGFCSFMECADTWYFSNTFSGISQTLHTMLPSLIPVVKIALPIGISFYTFQAISYLVDVYRGTTRAQNNLINFALYIAMFPQLIAGPIVRYEDVEQQIRSRKVTIAGFGVGCEFFNPRYGEEGIVCQFVRPDFCAYSSAKQCAVVYCDSMDRRHFIYAADLLRF